MHVTPEEKRRKLKRFWKEYNRVAEERHRILTDEHLIELRADYFVRYGVLPPQPELPPLPSYPRECVDMTCGGKGRRSGEPCKSRSIYTNGRCKWHGGASTGAKTKEGKVAALANLKRGSKI